MSHLVLYSVLRDLGVAEDRAQAAVVDETLVTKEYLKAELHELKSSLLLWQFSMFITIGTLLVAATAAVVRWIR